jgi:hypothetical protein
MRQFAKKLLCDWPYCALARPVAAMITGAAVVGAYALLCGALWGALQRAPQIPVAMGFRGVMAGGVAGLLMGLYSAIDRAAVQGVMTKSPRKRQSV